VITYIKLANVDKHGVALLLKDSLHLFYQTLRLFRIWWSMYGNL